MRGRPAGSSVVLNSQEVANICLDCNLPSKTCNRVHCKRFDAELKALTIKRRQELKEKRNANK